MKKWLCTAVFIVPVLGAHAAGAWGDGHPEQPIHIVSPYSPGGGNDNVSRLIGQYLGQELGQQVIVENRAGAGTMIGNEYVARSAPDGYTLILNGNGFVTNPSFYANMRYDTGKDIIPVAFVASSPFVLVSRVDAPYSTTQELIAYAKAHPGKLNFGNSGYGGPDHYACVMFNQYAKTDITSVPYKGSAQAISDLLGGQIQLMITPLPAVQAYIRADKMKLLAFATATRSPQYPDVPTIAEAGLPGYESINWYGLMAPAATPPAIVKKINAAVNKVLLLPEVRKVFAAQGVVASDAETMGSPEQFSAFLKKNLRQTGEIARAAGIKPQ